MEDGDISFLIGSHLNIEMSIWNPANDQRFKFSFLLRWNAARSARAAISAKLVRSACRSFEAVTMR